MGRPSGYKLDDLVPHGGGPLDDSERLGHIAPSSSRAASLKPSVEYRAENFSEPWKNHTILLSLA